MKYQRKTRPAPWTTTPKAQAQITQRARDKVARRIDRAKTNVRKRIASKSDEQRRRDRLYAPMAKWFKEQNQKCECCLPRFDINDGNKFQRLASETSDTHHSHGKIGALFFYFPWFKAVCRSCHDWIEANKNAARAIGMECEHGQFNVQATESVWLAKWKGGRTYVTGVTERDAAAKVWRDCPTFTLEIIE